MTTPFYEVRAWPFALQLAALTLVLVVAGVAVGRAVPETNLVPLDVGVLLPDPMVIQQLEALQSEDPIGGTDLTFRELKQMGTADDVARSGKGVLLANFDGLHDVDRIRFELFEGRREAELRIGEYQEHGVSHPEYFEVIEPVEPTWARFCLRSDVFGIECFARVENAVIRGRILSAGPLDKGESWWAGILINVGVKYWTRIFGPTKDIS